jgi:DNA-directed RNA polymerase subunit RPC12/RpoP
MENSDQKDYSIFSALVETIHKKDRKKLRFAKCQECGRLNPFRLISLSNNVMLNCKKCGSKIFLNTNQ